MHRAESPSAPLFEQQTLLKKTLGQKAAPACACSDGADSLVLGEAGMDFYTDMVIILTCSSAPNSLFLVFGGHTLRGVPAFGF
jgi:hypothetical protein